MTCTKINIQTQRFINPNLLTMLYVVDKKKLKTSIAIFVPELFEKVTICKKKICITCDYFKSNSVA